MGIGFWFLVMEILLFENLPVSLLIIINFFVGAGLGGLYSVLLESLMEKHFPVHELAIGTILAAVISVYYIPTLGRKFCCYYDFSNTLILEIWILNFSLLYDTILLLYNRLLLNIIQTIRIRSMIIL
jgi:uncharacterized protein involved in response to NO